MFYLLVAIKIMFYNITDIFPQKLLQEFLAVCTIIQVSYWVKLVVVLLLVYLIVSLLYLEFLILVYLLQDFRRLHQTLRNALLRSVLRMFVMVVVLISLLNLVQMCLGLNPQQTVVVSRVLKYRPLLALQQEALTQ